MSSHHIVREKQEPALLVLGLDDFSFEQLGQLLEWSPTVIATTVTFPLLERNHIKVDWLAADELPESRQTHIRLISQDVLATLVKAGYSAVNIMTGSIKGDIQELLIRYGPFADLIDIVIYTNDSKIYPVRSGFSKWKPAEELINIINPPADLIVKGLKQCSPGVYQTTADGIFSLEFTAPVIFIAEEI